MTPVIQELGAKIDLLLHFPLLLHISCLTSGCSLEFLRNVSNNVKYILPPPSLSREHRISSHCLDIEGNRAVDRAPDWLIKNLGIVWEIGRQVLRHFYSTKLFNQIVSGLADIL